MPPHANIDYISAVLYRSGNNTPAAQLQSLGDDPGGSLRIFTQPALVRVLADGLLEDDSDNNNFKIITMRDLEYLHITHLTFDGEIDQLSPYFIIKPPLWSCVFRDLNELGLEHEEGGHNWQSLWLLISNYMGKLTPDQRLVVMDDVEAHTLDLPNEPSEADDGVEGHVADAHQGEDHQGAFAACAFRHSTGRRVNSAASHHQGACGDRRCRAGPHVWL